jgi:hypothetical protein
MKKIGEYTLRGKVDHNTPEMIRLFDGSFKTGYRVVEFTIFTRDVSSSTLENYSAFLGTTNTMSAATWEWENQEQVAWSASSFDGNGSGFAPGSFTQIDPDNLIVEDLFVYMDANTGGAANYFIKLEKYSITDWQGALAMVKNNNQDV